MPLYRIADFVFDIEPLYDYTLSLCKAYEVTSASADFTLRTTQEECEAEKAKAQSEASLAYCEAIVIYRKLCELLAPHGVLMLHGATVKTMGKAFAFCAPSGTGKTTHMKLWLSLFPDDVSVLNGDKPLLRKTANGFTVYGTPWCGKEGLNTNDKAPLSAICFLERGKTNAIRRLSPEEALGRIFEQLLKPSGALGIDGLLSVVDGLLSTVPMFLLSCDISKEAALLSYNALTEASF